MNAAKRITLVTGVVMLGGYFLVFRPAEATIAERSLDIERQTDLIERRTTAARGGPALEREQRKLRNELTHVHLRGDRAVLVDGFLIAAAAAAAQRDIHITQVAANASTAIQRRATAPAQPSLAPATFDEVALDLNLRGTYADILGIVRDLTRSTTAARISIDSLTRYDRRVNERTQVTALIHATLLREHDEIPPVRPRPT